MRDLFAEAKSLDLVEFLATYLGNPKEGGRSPRFSVCPNCGESSNKSVKLEVKNTAAGSHCTCYRCGFHGSIIDAAMKIWGINDPLEAAKMLLGENTPNAVVLPKRSVSHAKEQTCNHEVLTIALKKLRQVTAGQNIHDRRWRKAVDYLTGERCLPESVVQEAMNRMLLGFMPDNPSEAAQFLVDNIGQDLLMASGLWKEGKKIPGISFRPIVEFFPALTSAEFRIVGKAKEDEKKGLRYGVSGYPWFWKGINPKGTMIVEGFIDMLSGVALNYQGHILALPGVNNWHPDMLEAFQKKNPEVSVYHITTDNDADSALNPGKMWAFKLKEIIEHNLRKRAEITLPEAGDLNDALRRRMKT
ncbi:toprim domain-containing protein [Acidithiobacillus sp.]|uniref:toprim domain-containing protein n=1 Tax=Acidithiobacillus sp. TaxID=1872118 RepID=UPI00261CE0F8|nr:toprim domain-containing protein [Acidithiobacillus sp.]MDD5278674.1 toprim domain-containing protein [Acidithiobacillus sp.]